MVYVKNQQHEMNLYYIKYTLLKHNNNVKIKCEIYDKNNLYSYCVNFGFKKCKTISEKKLSDSLKCLNYFRTIVLLYCLKCRKNKN